MSHNRYTRAKCPLVKQCYYNIRWRQVAERISINRQKIQGVPKKDWLQEYSIILTERCFIRENKGIYRCLAYLCHDKVYSTYPQFVFTCVNPHLYPHTPLQGHMINGCAISLKPIFFWDTLQNPKYFNARWQQHKNRNIIAKQI